MLWLFFALGSAFFAGVTAILAKIGIENVNSTLATAVRTVVVLIFSWLMVFIVGSQGGIADITGRTLLFIVLSGLATGASWLCYFRALQLALRICKRSLSEIMAINSEFVGFPLVLWMV